MPLVYKNIKRCISLASLLLIAFSSSAAHATTPTPATSSTLSANFTINVQDAKPSQDPLQISFGASGDTLEQSTNISETLNSDNTVVVAPQQPNLYIFMQHPDKLANGSVSLTFSESGNETLPLSTGGNADLETKASIKCPTGTTNFDLNNSTHRSSTQTLNLSTSATDTKQACTLKITPIATLGPHDSLQVGQNILASYNIVANGSFNN
ncbi:hypothetical protein [Dongshaea marina]|uniref:hypothetical protein n=1 Tax=Dongshaea marina TaxID=2047966 RepID=UPI00131F2BFA|nr:hypothetical protein [Dongshaea marina]